MNIPFLVPLSFCVALTMVCGDCVEAFTGDRTTQEQQDARAEKGIAIPVGSGKLKLLLPANWEKIKTKSRFVEHEIKVPKSAGEADDAADGRLTTMRAGGSVEANIDRWCTQYKQPDGSSSKDAAKTSKSTVAGCEVTWFDLTGTLMDKPGGGPFSGGKTVERKDYRTLAAIVQVGGDVGQYFVKLYGPAKTIADNEAAFKSFVESLNDGSGEVAAEKPAATVELTDKEVVVAKGGIKLYLPANWESVKPRSFVVEHEIKIPKSAGEADDAKDGRLTIMGAGGSVEANLDRWYGQYTQPDGGESKDAAKISETTVGDSKVTWFDLSGTLLDKPGGPFAGGEMIKRENYRTLAAIIQAGEVGQYFVKVYGPARTIADNEAAFKAFVESLKVDASKTDL